MSRAALESEAKNDILPKTSVLVIATKQHHVTYFLFHVRSPSPSTPSLPFFLEEKKTEKTRVKKKKNKT